MVAESATVSSGLEDHFDRALRLVPADAVAAYLAVRGFWMPRDRPSNTAADPLADAVLNWWLPPAGLLLTIFLRILGSSTHSATLDDIQWKTVILTALAFGLWVLTVQTPVFAVRLDPRIALSLLVVFSLVIAPLARKGA